MMVTKSSQQSGAELSGRNGCSGFWKRMFEWLEDHGLELFRNVSSGLMGLAGIALGSALPKLLDSGWKSWGSKLLWVSLAFFLVGLIGYIICSVMTWKRKPSMTTLLAENTQLDQEVKNLSRLMDGLPREYLLGLAVEKLKFGAEDNTERITLYRFLSSNEKGNLSGSFIKVCRYSPNPNFSEGGRSEYPAVQGCIARAWENGWHFTADFPDPEGQKGDYRNKHTEFDIPLGVVDKLQMKSRLYAGRTIRYDHQPVAVVIVESTKHDRWTEAEVKDVLGKNECEFISQLLKALEERLPDPQATKKAGF